MGWSNHVMTAPIGMGDISTAVGYSSLDLGTLITNGTINKWAKYKPQKVSGAPVGLLTDAQRRNGAGDGSRYGLSVNITGTEAGSLPDIHNSTFSYVGRPTGGITSEPYRMTDFIKDFSSTAAGYSDTAQPNPGVALNRQGTSTYPEVYRDLSRSATFNGGYNIGNVNGVDIADIVFDGASVELTKCYPCILIGNYFSLLFTNEEDGRVARPLKISDTNYPGSWFADLTLPAYGTTSSPFSLNTNYKCTIFLAMIYDGDSVSQATFTKMKTSWLNGADTGQGAIWFSYPVAPMPISNFEPSCGVYVTVKNFAATGMQVTPTGVALTPIASTTKTGIQTRYNITNATASSAYSISARVGSGSEVTKSISITAGQTSGVQAFTATELGVVFSTGSSYSVTVTVYKSGSYHSSNTFTVTC